MSAPWEEARALERPLSDGSLGIVARGVKSDGEAWGEGAKFGMVETMSRSASTRRRRSTLAFLVLALLSIPLNAMLFSDAIDWTPFDFAAAAALLTMAAVSYEVLIATQVGSRHRYLCGAVVIVALMLA